MATPQAHINFSSNAATPFTNVIVNDFVVYTDTNTQNIHLGVNQSGTSAMTVSYSNTSNSVTVQGNLIVTGSTSSCNFAISNILASNATITSNITVPYITMSNLTSSNATISNIVSWVHYSSNLLASNATVTSNITVPYITMSNLTSSNATISNIVSWVHYSSNLLASNATITSNITVPYITTSNLVSSNVGIGTSSTSLQLQIENSNQVFTGYWGPTIGTTSKDRLFLSSAAGGGISMTVGTSSNNTVIFDGSSLRPWIPGSNDLGSSGCPWGNIYASNCLTFPSIDGGKRLAIWTNSNAYSGIAKTPNCMELNLVNSNDYMKFGSFSNANSTGSDELMRLTGTGNLIMKGGTIGASSGATGSASGISIAVSSPCWVKLASIYNGSDTGQALKSSFRVIGQIGQSHNTYSIDVTITGNADSSGIAAHVIQDTVFNGSGLWGTNNIFDLVAVKDRTNSTTTLYAVCNTSAGLNSAITLNFQIFALDKNAVSTAQATFYTNKTYTVPFTSGVPGTITSSYDSALGSTLTQFLVSSVAKWIKVSDTNGNIGIGTSNPAFPLQIETTATLGGQVNTTGAVIGSSNTRLLLYTACNYLSFHCGTNSNQAVLLDGSNPAFRPWSNDCTDLGASAQRWNNIYTNNVNAIGSVVANGLNIPVTNNTYFTSGYSNAPMYFYNRANNLNGIGFNYYWNSAVYINLAGYCSRIEYDYTTGQMAFGFGASNAGATNPSLTNSLVLSTIGATVNGNLGIGTSSPQYPLHVVSSPVKPSAQTYSYFYSGMTSVGYTTNQYGNGTNGWTAYFANSILAQEYDAYSDIRIKTNIASLSSQEIIMNQLRPVSYEYIDKLKFRNGTKYGFIAQEVQEILPGVIKQSTSLVSDIMQSVQIQESSSQIQFVNIDFTHTLVVGDIISIVVPTTSISSSYIPDAGDEIKEDTLEVVVTEVIDSKTVCVDKVFEISTRAFVTGRKVDDFLTIDTDQILAIAVKTIQDLSAKTIALSMSNASLATQINNIQSFLSTTYSNYISV